VQRSNHVTPLELPLFAERNVSIDLLRLDLIHPQISGNKWFKLKYNLRQVGVSGVDRVLSFGGAWSNHIHALAYAGMQQGFETVGVIRGEEPAVYSQTLEDARRWGMRLHFVSRELYREKNSTEFIGRLEAMFGPFVLVPEGGSNALAVQGCAEILSHVEHPEEYQYICSACGTGATLAGLIASKTTGGKVLGVPVLKGAEFLYEDIASLLNQAGISDPGGWQLLLDSHEGGYAKVSPELADCLDRFCRMTGIELEPVYTGKLMLALERKLLRGEFPAGSRILMVHTGGMQGLRGMRSQLIKQLKRFKNSYNVGKTSA